MRRHICVDVQAPKVLFALVWFHKVETFSFSLARGPFRSLCCYSLSCYEPTPYCGECARCWIIPFRVSVRNYKKNRRTAGFSRSQAASKQVSCFIFIFFQKALPLEYLKSMKYMKCRKESRALRVNYVNSNSLVRARKLMLLPFCCVPHFN